MKIIDSMKRLFTPKSPVEDHIDAPAMSPAQANDYRLDLTLQNLLSIGAEFSPDDIIQLRKRARYGDPRWLYSLYDEMMRLGPAPQVLKAREAIKSTQSIWHATPDDADEDENSTDPEYKAARLIRDVTEEAWGKWLPDLKTHLATKYFYGIAAAQVMWEPKAIDGKWSRITDIRPIPARRFRLDPVTLRFKFLSDPYSFEGPFVDDLQKTGKLIFVESGADVEPLDQRGLLYQCLIPWAIMQFTVRWRAKRLQNFGMPPVMVKYPAGDPKNKATADQLAEILSSGTRAAIPSTLEASLLSAPGAGSRGGDPYEANIEWCEREYDKIILGHSQVSGVQVGAGSRTSSNDAIGLFKDVTNSRAKELDEDFRQQCFRLYVAREFGADVAETSTPRIESSVIERDDPTILANVALVLSQAGAGPEVAVEDLVERTGLKLAEDGETTLAGNVKGEESPQDQMQALALEGQKVALENQKKGIVPGLPRPGMTAQPGAAKTPFAPKAGGAMQPGAKAQVPAGNPAPGAKPSAPKPFQKKPAGPAKAKFHSRRQRFAIACQTADPLLIFGNDGLPIDVSFFAPGRPYASDSKGDLVAAYDAHPMAHTQFRAVLQTVQANIRAARLVGDGAVEVNLVGSHAQRTYVAARLALELPQIKAQVLRAKQFMAAGDSQPPAAAPLVKKKNPALQRIEGEMEQRVKAHLGAARASVKIPRRA